VKDPHAFDHRPDPVLGEALRSALAPTRDGAAFVARVVAASQRPPIAMVDVLARWSRLGIAAALLAALAAGYAVGLHAPADALSADSDASAMMATPQSPDASLLLASYSER